LHPIFLVEGNVMSAGTPNRVVRIPEQEWIAADWVRSHRNLHSNGEPWTMSDFIRIALREKIKKMARSRTRSPRASRRSELQEEIKAANKVEQAGQEVVAGQAANA
jgi:ABC-type proline/glycine betaine transport system ATPase subunit